MRCKSYSADFSNLWTYFTGQIYWLPKEAACPWRRLNKVSHFPQEKKSYFNLHSIELHTIRLHNSPPCPFTTNLSANYVIISPFVIICDKLYGFQEL